MSKQGELLFSYDEVDQVKLSKVTVYNWGSFNGLHTLNIDPEGTLITGENGSGKSTIIDALMTLLRPASRVSYNLAAAQEKKNDRNLVSYIRGSFGSMVDDEGNQTSRNLREQAVVTVIKALYEYTASKQQVALLGIFYINSDSTAYSDVKKIYSVCPVDVDVKELLFRFKNFDVRPLKEYLKAIEGCAVCDDNFSEYETHFRHRLHMDNQNAPALLGRALGLKKIDDLTNLIRTLVLEPGSVKEDAVNTIKQFDDLKNIHERLKEAQKQEEYLKDLPEQTTKFTKYQKLCLDYERAIEGLEPFVNRYAKDYYQGSLKEKQFELGNLEAQKKDEDNRLIDAKRTHEQNLTALGANGGDKTKVLENEIGAKQKELTLVEKNASDYNSILKNLGLPTVTTQEEFYQSKSDADKLKEDLASQKQELEDQVINIALEGKKFEADKLVVKDEIESLQKHRGSNLSIKYQRLREDLASSLNININHLAYIAELIEVKESESSWQGAIERALGGLRQTLLVSKNDYELITKWLNARHTGVHVRVQVVKDVAPGFTTFGNDGFLTKLNFKKHEFTPFLKQHLNNYDLCCVDSVDKLNVTEFSMTKEGLIHKNKGFFEKKDLTLVNDPSSWCIGFSNEDKLQNLNKKLSELQKQLLAVNDKVKAANAKRDSVQEKISIIEYSLKSIDSFSKIDIRSVKEQIISLQEQYDILIHDSSIAKLKEQCELSEKVLKQAEDRVTKLMIAINNVDLAIKEIQSKLEALAKQPSVTLDANIELLLQDMMKKLKFTHQNVFTDINKSDFRNSLYQEEAVATNRMNDAKNKISNIIAKFYEKWEALCIDWGSEFEAYEYYLKYLQQIEQEGLPKLVEEFKSKLNTEVTQSVACIVQKISQELDSIKDRIELINNVLKKAEFSENTYLSIEPKRIDNPAIKEFNQSTKAVMNLINETDSERRYKSIEKVINILINALNSNAQDLKSILDPRLRMKFLANVLDKTTGTIKDTLNSSSGKSGGEKEAFAGSVLAASLAYVLTPDNGDIPTYATVFLDEAFSNTSDKVSKRVLKIFKELNLHVNLITPFKNIELARDFARSLVIVEKPADTHNSAMCELTWQEYDEQLLQKQESDFKELGIELEAN